jgi:hypothetical protein
VIDLSAELLRMNEIHDLGECVFFGEHSERLADQLLREKGRKSWYSIQIAHTSQPQRDALKH